LTRRGLEEDGFVLFLSRLVPAKGVDDLINGYRASSWYGIRPLVICGAGPAEPELRALAGDDPWIRIFNDVCDGEKVHLMYACSAYCLPSKPRPEFVETFGIALAEKMLAGGPGLVITTETGGIPEATGPHALVVAPDSPVEITAALDRIAAMPKQERLEASQAAQAFARRFDRGPILSRLETLLLCESSIEPISGDPSEPGPMTVAS
jgi:glycosyltransferase involved in cell wall biosynthesis